MANLTVLLVCTLVILLYVDTSTAAVADATCPSASETRQTACENIINAVCDSTTCKCKDGSTPDNDNDQCLLAVSETDCDGSTNNCDSIDYATCEATKCKCDTGYTENNDKCNPNLGSECKSGDTCATANAECANVVGGTSTTCQCSNKYKEESGSCVLKAVSETDCDGSANNCDSIDYATCEATKCKCDTGYTENNDKCNPNLGSECKSGDACATANSECANVVGGTGTTCQCSNKYKEASGSCVAKDVSELECTSTDASNCPENAACNENDKCQCNDGYEEEGNQCSGAASTKGMILMVLSVLMVRLVDKLLV